MQAGENSLNVKLSLAIHNASYDKLPLVSILMLNTFGYL